MQKEKMKAKEKKFIALFLVLSLLTLPGSLTAKERRGAEIIVEKTDGKQISGELIAVKKKSLLVLQASGEDVSVDVNEIKFVTIPMKHKFWRGAGYGALIGGGAAILSIPLTDGIRPGRYVGEGLVIIAYLLAGVLGGITGGLIGGAVGALTLKDEIIQINGKSDLEIQEILECLRSKARIPDYQ